MSSLWKSWFPDPPTIEEMQKENCNKIRKAVRELKRERIKMEREEPNLLKNIKSTAEKGNIKVADRMIKNLIRRRNGIIKFFDAQAKLEDILMNLKLIKSTTIMAEAMRSATKTMMIISKQCNLPQMQHIMMRFEKENTMMDMKQEVMDDTIDDAMAMDGDEDAQRDVMNKIYEEIGIETADTMHDGAKRNNNNNNNIKSKYELDPELSNRINNLKN